MTNQDQNRPAGEVSAERISDFSVLIDRLRENFPYAEDASFSWNDVDAVLAIKLEGGDVHSSLRSNDVSHKDQIDLTYGESLPEGESPVDDFFPSLEKPKVLRIQRHLSIPTMLHERNLIELVGQSQPTGAGWKTDSVDLVRLTRNEGRNPSLQLRGVNELRKLLPEGCSLFTKRDRLIIWL